MYNFNGLNTSLITVPVVFGTLIHVILCLEYHYYVLVSKSELLETSIDDKSCKLCERSLRYCMGRLNM